MSAVLIYYYNWMLLATLCLLGLAMLATPLDLQIPNSISLTEGVS